MFVPSLAYSMCSGVRIPTSFRTKAVRRVTNQTRLADGSGEPHSRLVDETFRATEDEEIVEKASREAAAACANNGAPDPVVVTKSEHCKLDRHYVSISLKRRNTRSGRRLHRPCAPYPTIAVMMRGPRSRAGLMA
jgi:hypothetical protein